MVPYISCMFLALLYDLICWQVHSSPSGMRITLLMAEGLVTDAVVKRGGETTLVWRPPPFALEEMTKPLSLTFRALIRCTFMRHCACTCTSPRVCASIYSCGHECSPDL
jgi:hypothetical protein